MANLETVFTTVGTAIYPSQFDREQSVSILAPGYYTIRVDPDNNYYVVRTNVQPLINKIVGDVNDRAAKIVNTFYSRAGKSTGVLMSGTSGTGKTMLTKLLCEKIVNRNGIILNLQSAFSGSGFNKFLSNFVQPTVIVCDEYEKVYSKEEDKNGLLTLIDGMEVTNHRMWLLTCNDTSLVSQYLLNRPSRVFYHYKYRSLSREQVAEVCASKEFNPTKQEQLANIHGMFAEITYDVVTSLIEECNRYDLMPLEAAREMNIEITDPYEQMKSCTFQLIIDGKVAVQTTSSYVTPAEDTHVTFDRVDFFVPATFLDFIAIHPKYDDLTKKMTKEQKNDPQYLMSNLFSDVRYLNIRYSHVDIKSGLFVFDVLHNGTHDVQLVAGRTNPIVTK